MTCMFSYASSFNSDINKWDVSNVISTECMFSYTTSLKYPCDGLHWKNVLSPVEYGLQRQKRARMRWSTLHKLYIIARPICFHWLEKTLIKTCKEGGSCRKRDKDEFENEFLCKKMKNY